MEAPVSPDNTRIAEVSDHRTPPGKPVKEMLAKIRSVIFRGNGKDCPCCGRTHRQFLFSPYGAARCPYCLSYERYRSLCLYLREETDFSTGSKRVLEIGPAWCFQKYCEGLGHVEYVSIDIASPLAMYHMDIRDLEFDDETFDCIICYHVLEHIDDDRKALSELFRILKPGGWALITVPKAGDRTLSKSELNKKERDILIVWGDHLRVYGEDFTDLLESTGFDVDSSHFVHRFTVEEVKRFGLDRTEEIFRCTKSGGH